MDTAYVEYKCCKMENKHNVLDDRVYLLHILDGIRKVTGLGNNVMLKDLPKRISDLLGRKQFKQRTLQKNILKLKRKIHNSSSESSP
jgi:hypothetical protein